MFIVLEGIDGSGTTSQLTRLHAALVARGLRTHSTREPSGGPVGRLLRQVLSATLRDEAGPVGLDFRTLALLFAADRTDHVRREIEPALGRGEVVLCDRYDLSSLIYQSETSPDPKAYLPWLASLNAQALRPDLTIVLAVDASIAFERRRARGGAEELFEVPELQVRLATRYAEAARFLPTDRLVVLDGNGSLEEVERAIFAEVLPFLPPVLAGFAEP
jgi:dTMP kinase